MKQRLLYSLIFGLILTMLSLFYKTGVSSLEPMPYVNGCGHGGVCGLIAFPPGGFTASTSLAKRGFPLPIVSIRSDEDSPSNYYKSLIAVNLLLDYALYAAMCYGILLLLSRKWQRSLR